MFREAILRAQLPQSREVGRREGTGGLPWDQSPQAEPPLTSPPPKDTLQADRARAGEQPRPGQSNNPWQECTLERADSVSSREGK